jgi:DNA gyrase/topoisomerase IV subunit A
MARKEVKKWVAGFTDDSNGVSVLTAVKATFIDSPKTYTLKKEDNANYRTFSRLALRYVKFDKSVPMLMWLLSDTEEEAVNKFLENQKREIRRAEHILRSRERDLQVIQAAIQEKKWRQVQ